MWTVMTVSYPSWKSKELIDVQKALPDDAPDNVCPVSSGERDDKATADEDDTCKFHTTEDNTNLSIISLDK